MGSWPGSMEGLTQDSKSHFLWYLQKGSLSPEDWEGRAFWMEGEAALLCLPWKPGVNSIWGYRSWASSLRYLSRLERQKWLLRQKDLKFKWHDFSHQCICRGKFCRCYARKTFRTHRKNGPETIVHRKPNSNSSFTQNHKLITATDSILLLT